ncbi:HAD family hydrolase [Promicromonospora sp. NPDC057138]|uniref:HAD family hydrolase n=1 Tax=Promicromonospora sp. NPDC057138 TaxID=3346031 RepID=UPI003626CB27
MTTTTSTRTRHLLALDIDGTLLGHDGKVPAGTVDALDLVRAAGHEVVLATGRSLVGLMPIATRLGLTQGFAVSSNGTMTVDDLAATGVTVNPAGADWIDLTAPGTSKATALERLRVRLGIPSAATVAVGDGANDLDMLGWAGRGVAMGHAPELVRQAADEVTGTIEQHGAVAVLHSLLPAEVDPTSMSRLAAQLATAVRTAPSHSVVVRVWHGTNAGLSRAEVWVLRDGSRVRHAPVPAGTGVTMRAIESAVKEAGLTYPRGDEGRRRAHWRASLADDGPAGFELPLAR